MAMEKNQNITMNYTLKHADGTLIDSNIGREPLTFAFGMDEIIPGLETRIADMAVEEKKTVIVPAEEAYGPVLDEAIQEISKAEIGLQNYETGAQLRGTQEDGTEIVGTISKVNDESVVVDFNHPLAGHDLTFEVTILSID
jgi:FKBP-type peptidyl-prolyl cis-trans isomerase SlyD